MATIADGIAVKRPGDLTFALCQQYVDEIVTVSEDEIASAILALMEGQKTVAEGAGAVPAAAVMFGKVDTSEKKTVCLVSGGNVDVTTLSRIITKGLIKTGRIADITTKVEDKPGSLLQLLKVVADSGGQHPEHQPRPGGPPLRRGGLHGLHGAGDPERRPCGAAPPEPPGLGYELAVD